MPRWAGPPPLLIAATVLGILLAPAVSSADARGPGDGAAEQAVVVSAEPASTPRASVSQAPENSGHIGGASDPRSPVVPAAPTPAPSQRASAPTIRPRTIGVATFNEYIALSTDAAIEDALALTSRPGVSIIGWQEGFVAGPVYQRLRQEGWATKRYATKRGASELAVSWRKDEFALVGSALHKLADGVAEGDGLYPFGTRYALRVTLRDRATGEELSVIDTHLPQRVEDLERPGTWRATKNALRAARQLTRLADVWGQAPGRWVIGTGDYNIAALADLRQHNPGGVVDAYRGVARSSYDVLGFGGLKPTHPYSNRYIDYVHVAQSDLDEHRVELLGQRTPGGLNSDHRPLLVRMRLS